MEETEYEKGKMKYNIGLSQPPEKNTHRTV